MAIKQTHHFDIEKVFKELGHDDSDFIVFLNNNSHPSPIIQENQSKATDVIDKFICSIESNGLLKVKSKDTIKYYLSFLSRFKKYIIEEHKEILFADINEIIFNGFIERINANNKKNIKHSTYNTYTSILKRMCTFAAENNYTNKNINYKFTKIPSTLLPRYLSHTQIKDFF
jgi:site-specific recombinase XerD